MRTGISIELRVKKIVRIAVLYLRVADKEDGLIKLTKRSDISPKRMLVTEDVMITAYWIVCSTYMSLR